MPFTGYPTLTGVSPKTFTDEQSPTITYNVPAVADVRKIEACIADAATGTEIIIPYREVDINATSYTFNFTDDELDALYAYSMSTGGSVTFMVKFYLKTTLATGEIAPLDKIDAGVGIINFDPILAPTAKDINSDTLALTDDNQIVVPGYSALQWACNAQARKGAHIVSYNVTCGTQKSSYSSGLFNGVNSGRITFTITDSRGITKSETITLDTVNYIKVSCRQNVVANKDGTIDITLEGNYYNGSFGEYDNTLKLEIRHTQEDGTMGDWVNLTPLGYTTSGSTYTLGYTINGLDPSGSYTFQSRATDELGTATTQEQTITWEPIFDWGKDDFNFNVPVTVQGGTCYGVHLLYSGSADGNVVLYDEIDNYDFIDIYFTDNNGRGCGVSRLFGVNGGTKTIDLSLVEASSVTATYIRRTAYICKDRTLSPNRETAGYVHIGGTAVSHSTGTNYIRIIRVLGYK